MAGELGRVTQVGVGQQGIGDVGDLLDDGLVSADQIPRGQVDEFALAHSVRDRGCRSSVRRVVTSGGDEACRVVREMRLGRVCALGIGGGHHRFRQTGELFAILGRDAEQVTDQGNGELISKGRDEVDRRDPARFMFSINSRATESVPAPTLNQQLEQWRRASKKGIRQRLSGRLPLVHQAQRRHHHQLRHHRVPSTLVDAESRHDKK